MDHGSVFERWGRTIHHRRRLVLLIASVGVLFALVWGTGVFARLQTAGGFNAPGSQSQKASDLATTAFGRDAGDVVVLYSSPTLTTASSSFRADVTGTLDRLPRADVQSSATYWSTGSTSFVSASGHQTFAVLELNGATDTSRQDSYNAIESELAAPGLRTRVGGLVPTNETISN